MQEIFFKENVAIALASTDLRNELPNGTVIHKPYRSRPIVVNYTKGTDITVIDRSATDDSITVDTTKVVPFYVDDLDKIHNKWDSAAYFAADAGRLLNNVIDQAVLAQYANASSYVDDGTIGGTSGTYIALSQSNVDKVFYAAARVLRSLNIPMNKWFACVGGRFFEILQQLKGNRETSVGDATQQNGKISEFGGFKVYYSNNIPFTATWTPANNPSEGGTITINGCTLTFTATCDAAGEVLIGGNTAATLANLVACINRSGSGAGSDYFEPSDLNRWKLTTAGSVATNGTTYLGYAGYGDIVVATSDANDPWSVQRSFPLFGMQGASDLIMLKSPNVEFRIAEKRLGKYVYPWTHFGTGTFLDTRDALVAIRIDASSWV